MNARDEILNFLLPDESVEAVCVGEFSSWAGWDEEDDGPEPVPADFRGRILTWAEAGPLLTGWSITGGRNYALTVWTSSRVIAVAEHDGETWLVGFPRNPASHHPINIGG